MRYRYYYQSDIGTTREVNQDALIVRTYRYGVDDAVLVGVCDGLGGMDHGEQMSRIAAEQISQWFDAVFIDLVMNSSPPEAYETQLRQLLITINGNIYLDNKMRNVSGGTTISLLLLWQGMRYIAHVGDSRIYQADQDTWQQLTVDHSLVARELAAGEITEEEAQNAPNLNVLTQCIGVQQTIVPYVTAAECRIPATYVLCTDGFWHLADWGTLSRTFATRSAGETEREGVLQDLVERIKNAGERDNITIVVLTIN